jgi:RNA polymerase sigma factor (sigma-70 family)
MKHSERVKIFEKIRAQYSVFLSSILWKLTGEKELFAEAMQYALLGIWQHIEKLNGKKAPGYIYKIALTANSKAWRNRIGKNGHFPGDKIDYEKDPVEKIGRSELAVRVRKAISRLPVKQSRAIVMRYFEQQDYEDIAAQLSCSQAGARSNVSKAIATLKDKLAVLVE